MPWVLLALAFAVPRFELKPATEVTLWSLAYGVDPHLALAVQHCESGDHADPGRDRVVSRTGDYGRFQVNCAAMRVRKCGKLLDRHVNIRTGVALISALQDRYGGTRTCRCGQPGHHWIAHYNAGNVVGTPGENYAARVLWHARRLKGPASARRW